MLLYISASGISLDSGVAVNGRDTLGQRKRHLGVGQRIAALEYLQRIGLKNALDGILRGCTLEELGKMLTELRQESRAERAETESLPAGVK